MNRRQFCQLTLVTTSTLVSSSLMAKSQRLNPKATGEEFHKIDWETARLSLRAYRSVDENNSWELGEIEGSIPTDLKGKLLRVGPGLKEHQGTGLRHFFDGDAFYQSLSFEKGKVEFSAGFIDTPQRLEEKRQGRMLYNEFGTMAPKKTRTLKNQPNINIIPWRKDLLALSEGGAPVMINKDNHSYKEEHDFKGTLPGNVGFTAHPKFDLKSGKGFTYGVKQGASMAIMVYEMDPVSGKLVELYNLRQRSVYMIHDFMVSENYLVFLIPPATFKVTDILFNRGSMADALNFDKNKESRLLILDKKIRGKVREIKLPSALYFHHGNISEENGVLTFTTCRAEDGSLLDYIADWHSSNHHHPKTPDIYRYKVDIEKKRVIERKLLVKNHDFPSYNKRLQGHKTQFLYAAELGNIKDPFRFSAISKINIESGDRQSYRAHNAESLGEPVFHSTSTHKEDRGYVFVPGYDSGRDESFVDILNAEDFVKEARVWLGSYIPVGFHGNFISDDSTY